MNQKKTVVVIDDDPDMVVFVTSVLSPYYNVISGCSGKECLELVESRLPDVIFLDVIMSHLSDGLDCLRKLKESLKTKKIPVVMMTSVNEVYDYRSQIDDTFYAHDRWLDKPVKPEILLKTVRDIVGA